MSDEEDIESKERINEDDPAWKDKKVDMTKKKEPTEGGYGLPDMPNEIIRKYKLGVEFRGKLIGSDTVPSAKGDNMCHTALAKLKAAVLVAKQHKPRIIIKITDKELRLLDQDTRTDLHIHKLYKISYIVSDPNDRRAFGYVYGEKEGPWTFYGIKTEGAAIQTIVSIKELFEALASKQIDEEEAKAKKDGGEQPAAKAAEGLAGEKAAPAENAQKEEQQQAASPPKQEKAPEKTESPKVEHQQQQVTIPKLEAPSKPTSSEPTKISGPTSSPTTAPTLKKQLSVENMLLDIDEHSPSPHLKPRLSTEVQSDHGPLPAEAKRSSASGNVQDLLSDLFSPMSMSPNQPNPFGQSPVPHPQMGGAAPFMAQQPVGYFPPAGAVPQMAMAAVPQYANPYAGFGTAPNAYPPQQAFYGQTYANVPGYGGFNNPMQVQGFGRFPAPQQQAGFGFGQSEPDATASLTPQVAANAPQQMPVRQAPRPPAPTSEAWSFVGTGLPPRQDPGLFSEFLPGELEATQQQKKPAGNYVSMGEMTNSNNQATGHQ